MLEDLRLPARCDGLLYRADTRLLPRMAAHRHAELELNLVERGSITYVVDDCRVTLPARTLLWLFPGQEHQYVGGRDDARYWVAAFRPSLLRRACRSAANRPLLADRPPEGVGLLSSELTPEAFDRVRGQLERVAEDGLPEAELSRQAGFRFTHANSDWLNASLHHLLLSCWRLQRDRGGRNDGLRLHPAVRATLRRLAEPDADHGREALARRAGVSPAHLSRLFRREVGQSLTAYRTAVRLRRFREAHARDPGAGLTAAAFAAGFGSYARFHAAFVAAYGQCPREALDPARAGDAS